MAPRRPTGRSSAASDVPFAVCWGSLATSTSPGMITIAPPTPNRPDTTPATRPISATSAHVIARLLVQVVSPPPPHPPPPPPPCVPQPPPPAPRAPLGRRAPRSPPPPPARPRPHPPP